MALKCKIRHPYYPRNHKHIRYKADGNYCKYTSRLIFGCSSPFFDVNTPGHDGISVCVCARCGEVGRTIQSQEFSWSWIMGRVQPEIKDSAQYRLLRRFDASFCRSCWQRTRAEMAKARLAYETHKTLNCIKRELKNGSTKDNRATASVSGGFASGGEEWANGFRDSAQRDQDCGAN